MSCKQELLTNSTKSGKSEIYKDSEYTYILGISNYSGNPEVFKTVPQNPKLLLYGGDMLIYKKDVEVIKQYKSLDKNAILEIDSLKNKYVKDSITKNRTLTTPDTDNWYCVPLHAILWPRSTIYFSIDPDIKEPQLEYIYRAIDEWENATNLRFIEQGWSKDTVDTIHDKELYINDIKVDGFCAAYVGAPKEDGKLAQMLLSSSCNYHAILHEFGHVIGYTHEHQRPSRDKYLTMNTKALDLVGNAFGYDIYTSLMNQMFMTKDVYNDKIAFDFKSIMLYSSYSSNKDVQKYLKDRNQPLYTNKYGQIIKDEDIASISEEIIARTLKLYPEPGDICPEGLN
ncbi:MAG: M12 family metallopeptidase [Solitalea-like symbiont of Tyrophagus putrescentiae]